MLHQRRGSWGDRDNDAMAGAPVAMAGSGGIGLFCCIGIEALGVTETMTCWLVQCGVAMAGRGGIGLFCCIGIEVYVWRHNGR